jgi:hypothetical protein
VGDDTGLGDPGDLVTVPGSPTGVERGLVARGLQRGTDRRQRVGVADRLQPRASRRVLPRCGAPALVEPRQLRAVEPQRARRRALPEAFALTPFFLFPLGPGAHCGWVIQGGRPSKRHPTARRGPEPGEWK